MSAVVLIDRYVGINEGTPYDITSINTVAQTKDEHINISSNSLPIHIPFDGYNYSYWVTTRLRIFTPPALSIDNIKWYTIGSNPFGNGVSCIGQTANQGTYGGYRQAVGTEGVSGLELNMQNHTGISADPINVFTHTPSSPKTISGQGSVPGPFGDFFVYQIKIDNTVIPGTSPQVMFVWAFDET